MGFHSPPAACRTCGPHNSAGPRRAERQPLQMGQLLYVEAETFQLESHRLDTQALFSGLPKLG